MDNIRHAPDSTLKRRLAEVEVSLSKQTSRPLPFFGKNAHMTASLIRTRTMLHGEMMRRNNEA